LHAAITALLGLAALLWIVAAIELARGIPALPSLVDVARLDDADCPAISVLFAARDEAEKLPDALASMLAVDYPRYEVIAVDDRSQDATPLILREAAEKDSRLKVVRVDTLPDGWLGKPHALWRAYERSTGDWLVLTDADVHFAPELLRRSVALARSKQWDHLTLLGAAKLFTPGEKIVMMFFGLSFLIGTRPWKAQDAASPVYNGVGAFQLIRRDAYEKIGTHRRLAMEVVDDLKVGKLAKEAGLRSGVARAGDAVSVHWHAGVGNIIRGTTKNFFATSGFNLRLALAQVIAVLALCVAPAVALPFVHGAARFLAAIAVLLPLVLEAGVCFEFGISPLYALAYPFGAVIFAWMLLRSTVITLRQGGIVWRGTFYPLEELKKGAV